MFILKTIGAPQDINFLLAEIAELMYECFCAPSAQSKH